MIVFSMVHTRMGEASGKMSVAIPETLIVKLASAQRVAVLTGAGVSKESGVPTFRDKLTGLWERYRPEDLTSVDAFERNPALVWRWHEMLAEAMRSAEPNPGHRALARMAAKIPNFTLITQNIDGLHQRAGSTHVVELHGNIHRYICSADRRRVEEFSREKIPPRCDRCGAFLRHDVVWYGEMLPPEEISAATVAAEECEVFLSVGTSAMVQPAASLPYIALRNGATVVEINPQETMLSPNAHYVLRGNSGVVLPILAEAVWGEVGSGNS
jgi:NAD-dependent deacetylase